MCNSKLCPLILVTFLGFWRVFSLSKSLSRNKLLKCQQCFSRKAWNSFGKWRVLGTDLHGADSAEHVNRTSRIIALQLANVLFKAAGLFLSLFKNMIRLLNDIWHYESPVKLSILFAHLSKKNWATASRCLFKIILQFFWKRYISQMSLNMWITTQYLKLVLSSCRSKCNARPIKYVSLHWEFCTFFTCTLHNE